MTKKVLIGALSALAALAMLCGGVVPAGAAGSVRGFDGKTISVATIGGLQQFPDVPLGAQARIKRFNDTNEIKGIKIKYAEAVDDKYDQSIAITEQRRLVTQTGVFAIVGDVSIYNGTYFNQQKVPYFGWAFDSTYCSPKIDKSLYGFGYNGCLVPQDPQVMPDSGAAAYKYVSDKTGKKHPSLLIISGDNDNGKRSTLFSGSAYQGAGFTIAQLNNDIPLTQVGDYTPYVQKFLTADDGKPTDATLCFLTTQCIQVYEQMKANGYKGTFINSAYSDSIVKPMDGSVANSNFVLLSEDTPGVKQFKKDMEAFQPGSSSKLNTASFVGYGSTDMFIEALKTAAKKGKSGITPENVQKAAMNQTWQIKGLAGPTTYPKATQASYSACASVVSSDGTKWSTAVPYLCSTKQFKIDPALKSKAE